MTPLRTAILSSLLAGLVFACAEATPESLTSKENTAETADDDDDVAAEKDDRTSSAPAKKTETTPAKTTPAKTTPATTPATTTTTPATSSSSSGGIGGVLKNLPFKLSDITSKLGGLSGILNLLKGLGGGSSGGDFEGFNGDDLGDSVGCCAGTKFFACTSKVTTCSAANVNGPNCERAADFDDVCE